MADDEPFFISRQILREYLAAMTRQQVWGKALGLAEAIADTLVFAQRFTVLEDGPPVWAQLVELGKSGLASRPEEVGPAGQGDVDGGGR